MSSLYLDHFGLNKPPFQITPDLDFFFSGGRRGDILSALLHVAVHDEGIITLVAEVGSGKTLIARLMISRLGPEVSTVYLANPCFGRDEIIVAIARDLGVTGLSGGIEGKLAALQQELLRRHATGQRVLLVIDEAHAMPMESLEEVRFLSNLETGQHKLINIMLFGQPELDERLSNPRLRQVRDRVIHRFELKPLQADEANAYIEHRLRAAGWHGSQLISTNALQHLVKSSEGRARRINLLADKALLAAYAQGKNSVENQHVNTAVRELPAGKMNITPMRLKRWYWVISGFVLLVTLMLGWIVLQDKISKRFASPANASPVEPKLVQPVIAPVPAVSAPVITTNTINLEVSDPGSKAQITEKGITEPTQDTPLASHEENPAFKLKASHNSQLHKITERTQKWLRKSDMSGYTIQLAALGTTTGLVQYIDQLSTKVDASKIYAHESVYKGKTYMSVYFGDFESTRVTTLAIEELPASLRVNRPLVRSWVKIQQEISQK
jgi:MSHA biogenesis protein MshM